MVAEWGVEMDLLGSGPEAVPSSEHTVVGRHAATAVRHHTVGMTAEADCCQWLGGSAGKRLG